MAKRWRVSHFTYPTAQPEEMSLKHLVADVTSARSKPLKLAYLDHHPPPEIDLKGTILLIHGFPQTSYQYRHALPLLVQQGYRCIAPDYRGAGASSKPASGFQKSSMAADMIALLDHLGLKAPVHVIGHDIGGMIAFSLASRWPSRVKSVCWGECPLPGTKTYYKDRTEHAVQQFHFIFHSVSDLPEALIAGRERIYIMHFFSKLTYNLDAFSEADIDYNEKAYSQPGAIRCALNVYRAFEEDARENLEWKRRNGKCTVPTLVLGGAQSRHRHEAEEMVLEVTEQEKVEVGSVANASHYLTEENPQGFVDVVVAFVNKH